MYDGRSMRRLAWFVAAVLAVTTAAHAGPKEEELARARVLDQQGVRAYREGRYNDAITYFSEAFKLGGPPSELWNIAKCHLRLDQPQEASDAYERYLMQPGLSASDKAEATEQLEELRRRRSILTVASSPSRATVFLDGKRNEPAGTTPFSVQLTPGTHRVEIEQKGYKSYSQDVDAKFGRAIIVDAQLAQDPNAPKETASAEKPPPRPTRAGQYVNAKRFTAKAEMGFVFSKLGSYAQPAHLGFSLGGAYWLIDSPQGILGFGLRLDVTTDAWSNTINAVTGGPGTGCTGSIPNDESATEIDAFGVLLLGYRVTSRLRFGADLGVGGADYSVGVLGGDLFIPACHPSPGLQIAAHGGLEVSYAVLPMLRVFATPLAIDVHPAYSGARSSPIDASGAWVRYALGLGLAVDL